MGKVRVHQLAKEMGIEPKELIARLDKMGVRGKKAQSSLEDREVSNIRTALGAAVKPQVVVGEEKVVADRMVAEENQALGEIQTHEKVVERRVRTNVIRRRTSREEVVPQAPPPTVERPAVMSEEAVQPVSPPVVPPPLEEAEQPKAQKEEAPPAETGSPGSISVAPSGAQAEGAKTGEEKPGWVQGEGQRGARVLGRINLKREVQVEKKEVPGDRAASEVEPMPPLVSPQEKQKADRGAQEAKKDEAVEDGGKPAKGVRHKKRVVKREEVFDIREREFRSGRVPRKKRALPGKEQKKTEITIPRASKRVVKVSEAINVGDLARNMGVKTGEVIKKLMGLGMMATINQVLDADTATLVAAEFEYQVENVAFNVETALEVDHEAEESDDVKQSRPPVVTIMGHVDHGKTSLLDAIRSSKVANQEAGGITQHIGAYRVEVDGRSVTFLDTPGHEAFTAMRARGAKVTDIVVLVVAADDGVMPQTVEAINHARAAEASIIVAINKIDKPEANVDRVKRGLSEHGLVPDDWGGESIFVPVSAWTKQGIPQLLEMLLLQADILELRANPGKLARGAVIEARLDRGRGPVATVLVEEGTLRIGDSVVCGSFQGKIRAMIDDRGQKVTEATPSFPVEVLGLEGVPQSGDSFVALSDEAKAKQIAEHRRNLQREAELGKTSKVSLEEFYEQTKAEKVKELRIVLKADVHGSVEAWADAMSRLSIDEVKVSVIHGSVGGITESDILLAAASNAIVIGSNVRPEAKAGALAAQEGVEVRLYTVIYEALQDLKNAMEGLLEPTYREEMHGHISVREVYNIRGSGTVAGCYVNDGKVQRSSLIRLLRDQVVVHEGKLASLRRFKDDVREVAAGYECGLAIEGFQDVKVGDVVEAYERVAVARHIGSAPTGREASQASAADER
ncbi:MAG: translation initiation factor IF-2 [Candidatus Binatia bacterium]